MLRIGNIYTFKIFLHIFVGIRPVTQSMRLPKVTITQTLTMMMMNSHFTKTHGGHQRDDCFLPRLKVCPFIACGMTDKLRFDLVSPVSFFHYRIEACVNIELTHMHFSLLKKIKYTKVIKNKQTRHCLSTDCVIYAT